MTRARNHTSRANPSQLSFNNELRGSLKRVRNPPQGNPFPPDFAGTCTVDGNPYWIAGWINPRGARPTLDLVFQLAEKGMVPSPTKPKDLRLRTDQRAKPTRDEIDLAHYAYAPRSHRESGNCEKCKRALKLIEENLDTRFGVDPPY